MSSEGVFVYLDSSVALAHVLAEDGAPPESLWDEPLVSSRLLEHEIHTRLHVMGLEESHGPLAVDVLARVSMLELIRPILRMPQPRWPVPLRTLDALHLASMCFLRDQGAEPVLASHDRRLNAAAEHLRFGLYDLGGS